MTTDQLTEEVTRLRNQLDGGSIGTGNIPDIEAIHNVESHPSNLVDAHSAESPVMSDIRYSDHTIRYSYDQDPSRRSRSPEDKVHTGLSHAESQGYRMRRSRSRSPMGNEAYRGQSGSRSRSFSPQDTTLPDGEGDFDEFDEPEEFNHDTKTTQD